MKIQTLIIAFLSILKLSAQVDSSSVDLPKIDSKKSFLKSSVVPISLIGAGLFVNYSDGTFGKENLQEDIQDK